MLLLNFDYKPVSLNQSNCFGKGRFFRPKEYKDFKEKIRNDTIQQLGDNFQPYLDELTVSIKLYFKDERKRDLDNYLKGLLDALNGLIWMDDSQIFSLTITKYLSSSKEGIDVLIV